MTTLDKIIDVAKLEAQVDNIGVLRDVWLQFHNDNHPSAIADVFDSKQYAVLAERFQECPMFVLPLYKKDLNGRTYMTTFVLQAHKLASASSDAVPPQFMIVAAFHADFQRKKQDAPPVLKAIFFTELSVTKHVVLMRAEVPLPNFVNKTEATTLLRLFYQFYSTDALFERMVKVFTQRPNEFDFPKLTVVVRELNKG